MNEGRRATELLRRTLGFSGMRAPSVARQGRTALHARRAASVDFSRSAHRCAPSGVLRVLHERKHRRAQLVDAAVEEMTGAGQERERRRRRERARPGDDLVAGTRSSASPCTISHGHAGCGAPLTSSRAIAGATSTTRAGSELPAARTATAPPKENPPSHSAACGQRLRRVGDHRQGIGGLTAALVVGSGTCADAAVVEADGRRCRTAGTRAPRCRPPCCPWCPRTAGAGGTPRHRRAPAARRRCPPAGSR